MVDASSDCMVGCFVGAAMYAWSSTLIKVVIGIAGAIIFADVVIAACAKVRRARGLSSDKVSTAPG